MNDLTVREVYLGQCPADLGAQLDPVDRRELSEETYPGIDFALQGRADRHLRGGRRHRRRLISPVGREAKIDSQCGNDCHCADRRRPPRSQARLRWPVEWFSFNLRLIADLIHQAAPVFQKIRSRRVDIWSRRSNMETAI